MFTVPKGQENMKRSLRRNAVCKICIPQNDVRSDLLGNSSIL